MTAQSVHRKSARRRRFIQTIHARAEVERSTNNAVEERLNNQEDVSIESITRIYVIEYLRFQINKHL